ncbi:MAG: chemotaxis protein CheW [Candidatus Thermoplasmatota archaeon]
MFDERSVEEEDKGSDVRRRALKGPEEGDEALFTVFELGRKDYGLEIEFVLEILDGVDHQRVPGSPETVMGASDLRGDIVPVVDLKRCLGIGRTEKIENKVLVIEVDEVYMVPVDGLKDIISVEEEELVEPSEVTNLSEENLKWLIDLDDRSVRVLDIEKILERARGLKMGD